MDTILSVQPKESSGGKPGETREAIVYKIAEDMLRKLPRDYVPHEIKEALIRLGGLLPMNIFLRQEIDRMQKILSIGMICYHYCLIRYCKFRYYPFHLLTMTNNYFSFSVRNNLSDMLLAIEGTIVMSTGLRDILDAMYDARVPPTWERISWQSATIGFWFTELLERDGQFRRWCFHGRPKV